MLIMTKNTLKTLRCLQDGHFSALFTKRLTFHPISDQFSHHIETSRSISEIDKFVHHKFFTKAP